MHNNDMNLSSQIGSANNVEITDIEESCLDDSYNVFYDNISVAFRILSFVLFALFLFYIVVSAFTNAEVFSYENFEFIIRNFALTLEENKDDSRFSIEYNPDANRTYALLGDGLIVCGNSGVSVYSATGRLTCSESFGFKTPRVISSEKFALVYDQSNADYCIYNAFGRVYAESIDGIIRGAAIADNGCYALITSSEQYNTAVELYDDNFNLINRFNKIGYVVDIDISNEYLAIVTVGVSEENSYNSDIQIFDILNGYELFCNNVENVFPIGCAIGASNITFIGDSFTHIYETDGSLNNSYGYEGNSPVDFSVNGNSTALLFKADDMKYKYYAVVLDKSGLIKYDQYLFSDVFDIEVYNDWLYCLTEESLIVSDGVTDRDVPVSGISKASRLLSFGDGNVYVCTDTAAPLCIFLD